MPVIKIDPLTRLEGHLKIEVTVDSSNVVTEARVTGSLYRDFENMLLNRVPKDAAFLTQRVCGVCSVPHAIVSAKAIEQIAGFTPSLQAILLRNLVQGANFLASNILHFYHLALMDYIEGPQMNPWSPGYNQDFRFSASETQALVDNYFKAIFIVRKANEMGAIFAGKLPHAANIVPGGITARPTSTDLSNFRNYLNEIQAFINNSYQGDVNKLAAKYSDYYNLGRGYGNLICYGAFDTSTSGNPLFPSGVVSNGASSSFNLNNIKEFVKYSWYSSPSGQAPAGATTTPSYGKTSAYTWLKSPRYNNLPYEAGSLARMWLSGDYKNGISVLDRHRARYLETAKIASNMQTWLNQIKPDASNFTNLGTPASGSGVGLTEAPRGALGHWISVASSKVARYQIVTPTCWNASPMDDNGNLGPIEKSLLGVQVKNSSQPVELLRIIHSFDPCTGCAVHVMSPEGIEITKFIAQL